MTDGRILFAGGGASALETYDPITGTFSLSAGTLPQQYEGPAASRLADGNVLVAGGSCNFCTATTAASIYSSVNGTVTAASALAAPSRDHTATLLSDGRVLVAAGRTTDTSGFVSRSELFQTPTGPFTAAPSLLVPRARHTATILADGSVLVVGGESDAGPAASAERFDPAIQAWIGAGTTLGTRAGHTATALLDGTVLIVGGRSPVAGTPHAELFGPPLPAPTSLQITPASVTLQPDGTRHYSVVDELGRPRHDAVWATSDSTTATIGTYGNPTLTAIDYGQVTVTATIGGVSAQATATVVPLSLQVTPATATMLVGESRAFTVVDHRGKPTTRATWSNTAPGLASLSSGGQPILTSVATGALTLTANVQGVTAPTVVSILPGAALPPGTQRWTVPTMVGATSTSMVQSGSGAGGPSVFAISQSGTTGSVKALTADGQQLWEVVGPPVAAATPDAFGGVLLTSHAGCDNVNPMQLVNIGRDGIEEWRYTGVSTCAQGPPQLAVRHDGMIAAVTPGNISGFPQLMLVDGSTSYP